MTIKELIRNLLQFAAVQSESFSQGFPPRIQPMMNVMIYVGIVLFDCILLPVIAPYYLVAGFLDRQKPPVITPFMKFETALHALSHSPSSHATLHMLRTIHQQLRIYDPETLVKGIQVAPYGEFTWGDYRQVCWLLYQSEVEQQHWHEANALCDEALETCGGRERTFLRIQLLAASLSVDEWIIRKATMLEKLEGLPSAQRYIRQYLGSKSPNNPIAMYYRELQKRADNALIEHERYDTRHNGT